MLVIQHIISNLMMDMLLDLEVELEQDRKTLVAEPEEETLVAEPKEETLVAEPDEETLVAADEEETLVAEAAEKTLTSDSRLREDMMEESVEVVKNLVSLLLGLSLDEDVEKISFNKEESLMSDWKCVVQESALSIYSELGAFKEEEDKMLEIVDMLLMMLVELPDETVETKNDDASMNSSSDADGAASTSTKVSDYNSSRIKRNNVKKTESQQSKNKSVQERKDESCATSSSRGETRTNSHGGLKNTVNEEKKIPSNQSPIRPKPVQYSSARSTV